jgi:hypothetical protein
MEYLICRDKDYGLPSNDDWPPFEGRMISRCATHM